jgi:hypothetical protein
MPRSALSASSATSPISPTSARRSRRVPHGQPRRARPPAGEFGLRLQHIGFAEEWTRVVLERDGESLAARYVTDDDRLVAAVLVNRPTDVASLRRRITAELLAA